MNQDAQEAAFNDAFVDLMGTANDARIKDSSRYPMTQPTIGGVVIRIEDDGYVGDRLIKFPTEHVFDAVVRL